MLERRPNRILGAGVAFLGWLSGRRGRQKSRLKAFSVGTTAQSYLLLSAILFLLMPIAQAQAQDSDFDQIPDAYEDSTIDGDGLTLDLNKANGNDAQLDFDQDGLTNLAEYLHNPLAFELRDPVLCGNNECHPIIQSFEVDQTYILESGEVIVSWTTLNTVGAGRQLRVEPFGVIPEAEALSGSRTLTIEESTFFTMFATNENASRTQYKEVEVFEETQSNTYNAAHQRVRQVAGTTERLFVYGPNGELLAETTADGTPVVEYVYLEGEPLAQIHGSGEAAETYFVHTSHLGTPEVMTDSGRVVQWKIDTGPFGEAFTETGPASQRARFPGQVADAGTGIHYNWHRYYDPSIGRYISADPIGQAGGVNVFNYALSSPTNFIDAFGLDVTNNSPGPISILDETGGPQCVGPGETFDGRQDAFAVPGSGTVFKTTNGINAVVNADGSASLSTTASGSGTVGGGIIDAGLAAVQAATSGELDADEVRAADGNQPDGRFQQTLDQANSLAGASDCACQ